MAAVPLCPVPPSRHLARAPKCGRGSPPPTDPRVSGRFQNQATILARNTRKRQNNRTSQSAMIPAKFSSTSIGGSEQACHFPRDEIMAAPNIIYMDIRVCVCVCVFPTHLFWKSSRAPQQKLAVSVDRLRRQSVRSSNGPSTMGKKCCILCTAKK